MLDAVFSGIAVGVSSAFGSPFVDAVASWPGTPVKDDGGSIVTPGTAVTYACKVQFDRPTEVMRAVAGFVERDMRLLALRASLAIPLNTDAKIVVASGEQAGTWHVLSCDGDPAGIGWECRVRRQ